MHRQQQLGRYFDQSSQPTALIEGNGTVLYSNSAFAQLVRAFHVNSGINLLMDVAAFQACVRQCLEEDRLTVHDNADINYRFEFHPMELINESGSFVQVAKCTAQARLQAQHSSTSPETPDSPDFKGIVDYLPLHLWACSLKGEVFWTNRSSDIFTYGKDEVIDLSNAKFVNKIHPDDLQHTSTQFSKAMVDGKPTSFRYRLRDHTGQYFWFLFTAAQVKDAQGQVKYWAGSSVNIAALVEVEDQLKAQVERLSAQKERLQTRLRDAHALLANMQKVDLVAHLAGGVAHDLNNLLFVMGINLGTLNKRVQDQALLENIQAVRDCVKKAARLSSQLSGFSGRMPQNATTFNPAIAFEDLHSLLRQAVGAEVSFNIEVAQDLHKVHVDKTYLENALINLAINARDAVDGRGCITVKIANRSTHVDGQESSYVVFSVEDDGSGMSPDIQERIFEPFFTTKEPGKGTGLGLVMVKTFVENSQGYLEVSSTPGQGTSISIYLPQSNLAVDEALASEGQIIGGRETVMLVEDNDAVRKTLTTFLYELGYEISTTFSHEHAIMLLSGGLKVDLILSDIKMPGKKTALDLIEYVETHDRTPLIFATGYSAEIAIKEGLIDGRYPVMFKPFSVEDLAAKIRTVLDAQPPKG